jgi:hypothetical protein
VEILEAAVLRRWATASPAPNRIVRATSDVLHSLDHANRAFEPLIAAEISARVLPPVTARALQRFAGIEDVGGATGGTVRAALEELARELAGIGARLAAVVARVLTFAVAAPLPGRATGVVAGAAGRATPPGQRPADADFAFGATGLTAPRAALTALAVSLAGAAAADTRTTGTGSALGQGRAEPAPALLALAALVCAFLNGAAPSFTALFVGGTGIVAFGAVLTSADLGTDTVTTPFGVDALVTATAAGVGGSIEVAARLPVLATDLAHRAGKRAGGRLRVAAIAGSRAISPALSAAARLGCRAGADAVDAVGAADLASFGMAVVLALAGEPVTVLTSSAGGGAIAAATDLTLWTGGDAPPTHRVAGFAGLAVDARRSATVKTQRAVVDAPAAGTDLTILALLDADPGATLLSRWAGGVTGAGGAVELFAVRALAALPAAADAAFAGIDAGSVAALLAGEVAGEDAAAVPALLAVGTGEVHAPRFRADVAGVFAGTLAAEDGAGLALAVAGSADAALANVAGIGAAGVEAGPVRLTDAAG